MCGLDGIDKAIVNASQAVSKTHLTIALCEFNHYKPNIQKKSAIDKIKK